MFHDRDNFKDSYNIYLYHGCRMRDCILFLDEESKVDLQQKGRAGMGSCGKKIFTQKKQNYSAIYLYFDFILFVYFFLAEGKRAFFSQRGENLFFDVFFNILSNYISYRTKL